MENLIITDWNSVDCPAFYAYQSTHHPLIYSAEDHLWIVNSYACCKSILSSPDTKVPQPARPAKLHKKATLMLENLVRINNGELHIRARTAAILLYEQIKKVDTGKIMDTLLTGIDHSAFDWVETVAKRLPAYTIARGLSFTDQASEWIVKNLPKLNKVMLPAKSDGDISAINDVIEYFHGLATHFIIGHTITDQLVESHPDISGQEAADLLICNLLGLFIQSYDACRALLTISVNHLAGLKIERKSIQTVDEFYQKLMNELLRFDPPVHNTRRIAVRDIGIGDQVIKSGETILVVMGAANMDHMMFREPEHFDIERDNSAANLTFGFGGHACIAKYFCIGLATDACRYIVDRFDGVQLMPQEIRYEAQLNVKMAKRLMVSTGDRF